MEQKDRRSYDISDADRRQQAEIERLITEEEDPKARLTLMVLNKINLALVANTNVTNSIRNDLDEHLKVFAVRAKEQDELINKGRGAWWVISGGLVLAQVIFGALWMTIRDDVRIIRSDTSATMVEQAKRSSRLDTLEQTVGYLISGAAKK
jgi:hypothetical protein